MKIAFLALLTLASLDVAGCKDQATIAAHDMPSPDGNQIASIRIVQYGGPGTAAVIASVALSARDGSHPADVLVIEQPDDRQDHVGVRWVDATHLLLTVRAATIDFQAVRCAGVTVTTTEAM